MLSARPLPVRAVREGRPLGVVPSLLGSSVPSSGHSSALPASSAGEGGARGGRERSISRTGWVGVAHRARERSCVRHTELGLGSQPTFHVAARRLPRQPCRLTRQPAGSVPTRNLAAKPTQIRAPGA